MRGTVAHRPLSQWGREMASDQASSHKKGIWIDGVAFWNMLTRVLRVRQDFNKIYDYFVHKIGTTEECIRPPRYVLNPRAAGLEKLVRGAGFDPVVISSHMSEDDEFIKEEISNVGPDEVGEIMLVTADGDYIPCLLEKARQGIHVIVVATKVPDVRSGRGRMMLSSGLLNPLFTFVELADICEKLGTKIHKDHNARKVVSATFEVDDSAALQAVVSSLSQLTIRHPSITKFKVEIL